MRTAHIFAILLAIGISLWSLGNDFWRGAPGLAFHPGVCVASLAIVMLVISGCEDDKEAK